MRQMGRSNPEKAGPPENVSSRLVKENLVHKHSPATNQNHSHWGLDMLWKTKKAGRPAFSIF
jgi:hypothetical protein